MRKKIKLPLLLDINPEVEASAYKIGIIWATLAKKGISSALTCREKWFLDQVVDLFPGREVKHSTSSQHPTWVLYLGLNPIFKDEYNWNNARSGEGKNYPAVQHLNHKAFLRAWIEVHHWSGLSTQHGADYQQIVITGSNPFLTRAAEIINQQTGIANMPIQIRGRHYRIVYTGKRYTRILQWLYQGATIYCPDTKLIN